MDSEKLFQRRSETTLLRASAMHGVVVAEKDTNSLVRIVLLSKRQRCPQRMRDNDVAKLFNSAGSEELRERASAVHRYGDTQTITHSAHALNAGVQKTRVAIIG